MPLDALLGPGWLVECPPGPIRPETVAGALRVAPRGDQARLIFKTANSDLWARGGFVQDCQALTLDMARTLVEARVRLVGIDYLSIEAFGGDYPVHRSLLEAGLVILEGLDLRDLASGAYGLCCLPLRIRDGDEARARVVLRRR